MSLLLSAVVILGFTACSNDDPHESESGVAIALDNSRCPDAAIGQTRLLVYGTDGNLCATYDYADAQSVASALLPLDAGHYTIVAVINADEAPTETATLTALHEWVAAQSGVDGDLLSGIADADVTGEGVTRVTIPLYQNAFSLPVLSVRFSMPEGTMPDYIPAKTRSQSPNDNYSIRCVVELFKAGTNNMVLHKVVTPKLQNDGSYIVELELDEGDYDISLWADYASADAPYANVFYNTGSLKAVTLSGEPYTGNTDAKDAAYGNESGITLPKGGTTIDMSLHRPLAKYKIIANDVETYRILMGLEPDNYPPLEDLTVTVQYEGYFPSEFNALKDIVTDATTGIAFSKMLTGTDEGVNEMPIASDWLMAGKESSVTVTLTVSDSNGNKISSVSGVTIPYRQGCQTIITGKFLTAGVNVGGITIEPDWDEVIIEF